MIADALKLIQDTARAGDNAGNKVAIIEIPKDPNRYAIVRADGSVDVQNAAPPPRKHTLGGVDQVGEFVALVAARGFAPTVWYDEHAVVVVIDDNTSSHREDVAQVQLNHTTTFNTLDANAEEWIPQKAFVRLLRIDLADAATESSKQLLRVCRVIGFTASAGNSSVVEHGRQSLGRDIEQQIKSEVGDLPEEITLNVRVFDDPSLTRRFAIRCAVDVEPRDATFNVCPLPGSLGDALDEQLGLIGDQLAGAVECPVFRGHP